METIHPKAFSTVERNWPNVICFITENFFPQDYQGSRHFENNTYRRARWIKLALRNT